MNRQRWYLGKTWVDPEELAYNGGLYRGMRRGLVRMPDGKLCKVRLGVPDTFFSIPAKPSKGRRGCVMINENKEFEFYPECA